MLQAAEKAGTIFIMSTISTSSIEEVSKAAPKAIKWFQLYIYKDREVKFNSATFSLLIPERESKFFS